MSSFSLNSKKYFDINNGRLMLSLGPLSSKRYCTFACKFCYVQSDNFPSNVKLTIPQIEEWIKKQSSQFNIIYVSGDTDSFAKPRTEDGLNLLEMLIQFRVDVLFTTRALFTPSQLLRLSQINQALNNQGNLLIPCISISQLHHPHIEPSPIPSPLKRIDQLKSMKELNLNPILALRPFLPVIPPQEYLDIISLSKDFINVVLGSDWYADTSGLLESKILSSSNLSNIPYTIEKLDFYATDSEWKVYKNMSLENEVRKLCTTNGLQFFMRSGPAVDWLRFNSDRAISQQVLLSEVHQ